MKRFLIALITMIILCGCASAEIDLSDMSYDELLSLQREINLAIWECEEWQSVTVNPGVYIIGVDIPAGRWVIKPIDGHTAHVKIGSSLNNDGSSVRHTWYEAITSKTDSYYKYNKSDSATVILTHGYIEIDSAPVIFEPFVGTGFAFN